MRPRLTSFALAASAAMLVLSAGCAAVDSARSQIGLPRTTSTAANEPPAPDSLSDRIGYPRFLAPPPGQTLGCVERSRYPITPGVWYGDDMLFGMTPQQVVQLIGPPAQQHYGRAPGGGFSLLGPKTSDADSFLLEMLYPGKGRLIFGMAPTASKGCTGLRVKLVIVNVNEPTRMKRENAHLKAYDGPPPAGAIPAVPPGLDASGNVVDSLKVEFGYGQSVRGRSPGSNQPGPFLGEVFGKPGPDSLFGSMQVGMLCGILMRTLGQAPDIVIDAPAGLRRNLPGYQGDQYFAAVYEGSGTLILRQSGITAPSLIGIVNNANEKVSQGSSRVPLPSGCTWQVRIQDGPPSGRR